MVGDLVGDRPQQEALGAGHPLVAHDHQVRVLLLCDIEDRIGGITLARVHIDGHSRLAGHRCGGCKINGSKNWDIDSITAVRLKVEENQLVDVFGEIGFHIDGLKGR